MQNQLHIYSFIYLLIDVFVYFFIYVCVYLLFIFIKNAKCDKRTLGLRLLGYERGFKWKNIGDIGGPVHHGCGKMSIASDIRLLLIFSEKSLVEENKSQKLKKSALYQGEHWPLSEKETE